MNLVALEEQCSNNKLSNLLLIIKLMNKYDPDFKENSDLVKHYNGVLTDNNVPKQKLHSEKEPFNFILMNH